MGHESGGVRPKAQRPSRSRFDVARRSRYCRGPDRGRWCCPEGPEGSPWRGAPVIPAGPQSTLSEKRDVSASPTAMVGRHDGSRRRAVSLRRAVTIHTTASHIKVVDVCCVFWRFGWVSSHAARRQRRVAVKSDIEVRYSGKKVSNSASMPRLSDSSSVTSSRASAVRRTCRNARRNSSSSSRPDANGEMLTVM